MRRLKRKYKGLAMRRLKRKPNCKTFVYVAEDDYYVKVGFSKNVPERIKRLQRWNGELTVLQVLKGTYDLEQDIHKTLQRDQEVHRGEWYPKSRKQEILNVTNQKYKLYKAYNLI